MSEIDKVEELIEWVAKKYEVFDGETSERIGEINCSGQADFEWKKARLEFAKQILSHPDLALIDRERELPNHDSFEHFEETYGRRPKDIVFAMGQQFGQQSILEAGFKKVIPLAEAIKEMKE